MRKTDWKLWLRRSLLVCLLVFGMTSLTVSAATITLNKSKLSLYIGQTTNLKATALQTVEKVKWKSSKKSVATVSPSGKITAKKAGKTTITATVEGVKAKCVVTVKKPTISLNKTKLTLYAGDKKTLTATVKGKSQTVKWTSSNKAVASVSSNGKITAKKKGTATITAKANGVKVKCKVTVKKVYTQKQAIKGLKNYVKKVETPNFYYYDYGKEGDEYVYWVTFTGPGMKMKYYVNCKNGKIYEAGPAFGIDMWLNGDEKRLVGKLSKYL